MKPRQTEDPLTLFLTLLALGLLLNFLLAPFLRHWMF
jgi:hypothetical protein